MTLDQPSPVDEIETKRDNDTVSQGLHMEQVNNRFSWLYKLFGSQLLYVLCVIGIYLLSKVHLQACWSGILSCQSDTAYRPVSPLNWFISENTHHGYFHQICEQSCVLDELSHKDKTIIQRVPENH